MADSLEQAAKKALVAMEFAVEAHRMDEKFTRPRKWEYTDDKAREAITALRSALHQEAGEAKREIVGWVRQEEYALAPRFLNGPARPPADLKANYRPVVYDTSTPIEQKDARRYDSSATEGGARVQADAHLRALLRYTENFYGAAIEHGMKAGDTANAIAHIERAGKALHQLVHAWADVAEQRLDAAIATRQGTK